MPTFDAVLIDDRLVVPKLSSRCPHHEISVGGQVQLLCPLERERDAARVGLGGDDEGGLQLPPFAGVDEVHAGINNAVMHLGAVRDVPSPLGVASARIVRRSRKLTLAS